VPPVALPPSAIVGEPAAADELEAPAELAPPEALDTPPSAPELLVALVPLEPEPPVPPPSVGSTNSDVVPASDGCAVARSGSAASRPHALPSDAPPSTNTLNHLSTRMNASLLEVTATRNEARRLGKLRRR